MVPHPHTQVGDEGVDIKNYNVVMGPHEERFFKSLTETDRISNRLVHDKKTVTEFSVQYEVWLVDKWVKVVRYDTCDEGPHKHIFHKADYEYRSPFPCSDLNQGFTLAQKIITENYKKMRNNYLTQSRRRRL